jgi:hypothetical protein
MDKEQILDLLSQVNERLSKKNVKAEICLYGGAVMCLVYNARPSTKDVDAIFQPSKLVREAIEEVADGNGLPHDWMNDGVKGFIAEHPRQVFGEWTHLSVFVPDADYLLAMKCLSARVDGADNQDIRFLLKNLGLKTADQVFTILERYYPRHQIKPATQFFIEEILSEK